jgi:ParB family chromosome partitioning protein
MTTTALAAASPDDDPTTGLDAIDLDTIALASADLDSTDLAGTELPRAGELPGGELEPGFEGFVGVDGSTVVQLLAQQQNLRFEYADPNQLLDNPRNLRASVAEVEDLKASMAEVGILCPLVVVPTGLLGDGPLMIEIGHRRKYAAIALGFPLVPVVIAPDEGAAKLIFAQLAENGHRVGLTATEEAEGFHQLTLLDWTPEKIAKARHIPTAKVKQSLALRTLPEAARDAADTGALTLDDAAVMAEFTDQPAAMNRILKSASSGWGFRHAVATERSKQTYAAAKEKVKAELVLAGVKITPKPKGWGYESKAIEASRLVDADGNRLEVAEVRTRPGFAAWIDKIGDAARAVVYCTDPEEYGYKVRTVVNRYTSPLSEEQRAAREQAEQEKAAYLEALTVASGVRADFYRRTYNATKMIKELFEGALREAVVSAGGYFEDVDDLYTGLGGVEGDALAAAKEGLLRRCLVAKWIIRNERNLRQAQRDGYNYLDDDAAAAWLDRLVAGGYVLSDAETQLRQSIAEDDDADEADEDEDEDTEDVEDEEEDLDVQDSVEELGEDKADAALDADLEAEEPADPVAELAESATDGAQLAEVIALHPGGGQDEPAVQAA